MSMAGSRGLTRKYWSAVCRALMAAGTDDCRAAHHNQQPLQSIMLYVDFEAATEKETFGGYDDWHLQSGANNSKCQTGSIPGFVWHKEGFKNLQR